MTRYTYLALGDSYTIGEQVSFADNFPNQTVQLLRNSGFSFHAAEIIAKTGWTTDELSDAIEQTKTLDSYDIVTLLVGVNNQYRGRSSSNFEVEFEHLLQKAIQFTGNQPSRVFVLSIPDWGVTPFAAGKDVNQVAKEIDAYNNICENAARAFNTGYINITDAQRIDGNKTAFLAPDSLHPSGLEYSKWAKKLYEQILKSL